MRDDIGIIAHSPAIAGIKLGMTMRPRDNASHPRHHRATHCGSCSFASSIFLIAKHVKADRFIAQALPTIACDDMIRAR